MSAWARLSSAARRRPYLTAGLTLAALLLVSVLVVFAGLQTRTGKDALARILETVLSTPGASAVEIRRIEGLLPGQFRIDRVTVADTDGVWFSAEDISFDWRPLSLLKGSVAIKELVAENAVVMRRPIGRADDGEIGKWAVPLEIAVDLIAVRSLVLKEPVLGTPASLRVEASAAFAERMVEAAFTARRTDDLPGSADLWLSFDADTRVLDLDAAVSEPQGGLIARLARLPGLPAVDFSVAGEGPKGAWLGDLAANAEGLLSVNSRISVSLDQGLRIRIDGSAKPGPGMPPIAAAALTPRTDFGVDLTSPADSTKLHMALERIESAFFQASGSTTFDLDNGTVASTVSLAVADATSMTRFMGPVKIAAGTVEIAFDGPLAGPAIAIRGQFSEFLIEPARAKELTLDVRIDPDGPYGSPDLSLSLNGGIETTGFASSIGSLDPLLGPSPRAEFVASYSPSGSRIDVSRLAVTGEGGRAAATGAVDLAPWGITATGDLDLPELARLSSLAQRPLGGSGRADYTLAWTGETGLDLQISGAFVDPKVGDPAAEALLGQRATLAGRLKLDPDGGVSVTDLHLSGRAIDVSGTVSLPPAGKTVSGDYAVRISDLAPLGLTGGKAGAGKLEARGEASGPANDPTATGNATIDSLLLGGTPFDRLTLDYKIRTVLSQPTGEVSLRGTGPLTPDLAGRFRLATADDRVRMDDISASSRDTTLAGNIAISLTGAPATGRLQIASRDIGRWSDVAGIDLAGTGDASVLLTAEEGRQAARVTGTAHDVAAPGIRAATVEFKAALRGDDNGGTVVASATASRASLHGVTLSRATVGLDGTLRNAVVTFEAEGEMRGALKLSADGRLVRTETEIRITVARLSGEAAGQPVLLTQPVALTFGETIMVDGLALDIGGGRLVADFRLSTGRAKLDATATAFPLAFVAPELPHRFAAGRLEMEVSLDGHPTRPDGTIRLSLLGLAPGESEIAPEGLTLHFDGTLRGGTLAINGRAAGLESVETDLNATIPVRISLSPVEVGLLNNRPAKGRLSYEGPIEPAWALTGLDRHRLSGRAGIALGFSGTLENPLIDGRAELTGGRYENLDTGTILSEIEFLARPSASAVIIERAAARDGADGQVSASGRLDFGVSDQMAMNLTARFEQARLVRRDELVAAATGELTLTGTMADRLLAGKLTVNEAEIRLVGGLPQNVVEIDVIEKGAESKAAEVAPSTAPSRTRLELEVDMPKRVFVRGRGLDSEWGGKLVVSGTTTTPRIEGELRPLRGRYEFAGKTFTLQDGSIGFTGAREINPTLDLSAARRTGDLVAIVRLTGTARRPRVHMESEPVLPQDEVLSRVLFNKSTGRLSATEALRLSQAVATLSGAGDGGGFMDFARGLLNLDVLRFSDGETGEDGTAQAGKYLTDKVFIGVEAGRSAGSTGATVEVEITPNLKIEGDVSGDEKSEIGIKWKRDY